MAAKILQKLDLGLIKMKFALLQNEPITCKISEYFKLGGVAKRPKATVCKTVIRRFESGRRLLHQSCDIQGTICFFKNMTSMKPLAE